MTETAVALPRKEQFSEQVHSIFKTDIGEGRIVDFELDEFTPGVFNSDHDSFSLIFRAPADVPPVQHIYRMEHASLGAMDLFLVPIKQNDEGLYFEAVFNQLLV